MSDGFWSNLEKKLVEEEKESIRKQEEKREKKEREEKKALAEAERDLIKLFGEGEKKNL